ncbi:MAG: YHS domain-containing protein, partial [Euryarchaeota archaeon]|nr:YHS domain-containing protein [Euryarchaeota archaeon]
MKVIDPVCNMTIEDVNAAGKSSYNGKKYYFCSKYCKESFDKDPESFLGKKTIMMMPKMEGLVSATSKAIGEMAKDPICGMVILKERSIKRDVGGRSYYFCSENCVRTFEAPEAELKSMKRRVAIALTGVLALAVLRAAAFLTLAAGVSIVTYAPIPWLPWFTWGIWLFILTTPIMIFGGKGFFIGAYHAVKNRVANMDLLIALGTSTAYIYSAFV